MKKWLKAVTIVLALSIILPGLIYLGLVIYYKDSFLYGTWINGIYCTGKTVEEVAKELEKDFYYEKITVQTPEGEEVLFTKDIDIEFDFIAALEEYRKDQNAYQWYRQLILGHRTKEFFPKILLNQEKLREWLLTTKVYQKNLDLKEDHLTIQWGDKGYYLKEDKALILNVDLAAECISEAVEEKAEWIDLKDEGCYFYRDETIEMQKNRELYEKVDEFQSEILTYEIKEISRQLTSFELGSFLEKDKQGNLLLDQEGNLMISKEAVASFIAQLARDYDSWQNYTFITHDGKEIHLKKGNYGIQISQRKEIEFLMDWLENPKEEHRIPIYAKDITFQNRNKIDTTYIEIDMTIQKMFYYKDGKKLLETDIVTGWTKAGMGTPEMVCHIQAKTRNAILKGSNYRSFVNYWMPVYGGIGIHDASWRDEFGGQIYMKSGSHGCINTPLERMADLFEMTEKGTPVVIHY